MCHVFLRFFFFGFFRYMFNMLEKKIIMYECDWDVGILKFCVIFWIKCCAYATN